LQILNGLTFFAATTYDRASRERTEAGMAAEYQEFDWRVVDYALFCLDEQILDRSTKRPLFIRGPRPERLDPGEYFVCLGAAQTFGRFCERPFPVLLEERLSLPVLNISRGGAGPAFFGVDNARLLHYLNRARFVVIQVMSARSDGNSLFESEGIGYYRRKSDGTFLGCDQAFDEQIRTAPKKVLMRIVEETRQSWCASYDRLLSAIGVPKILLWLSTRTPAYKQGWRSLPELFGPFPQLVNEEMVCMIRRHCDLYVECTSTKGLPQVLKDRFTGEDVTVSDPWTSHPWAINSYYPSPQMHEDAADALELHCRAAATMDDGGCRPGSADYNG
jgi:Domain of unknown function (DUF6473)